MFRARARAGKLQSGVLFPLSLGRKSVFEKLSRENGIAGKISAELRARFLAYLSRAVDTRVSRHKVALARKEKRERELLLYSRR